MTTSLLPLRTLFLGLAALSAAPLALARDNVYWSIGVSPAPGVFVDASNLPPPVVYTPPRMVYASPVYLVQPAPPHWHTPHQGRGYGHGHGLGKGHAKWHGHGD